MASFLTHIAAFAKSDCIFLRKYINFPAFICFQKFEQLKNGITTIFWGFNELSEQLF
jgi:hypothetical protein